MPEHNPSALEASVPRPFRPRGWKLRLLTLIASIALAWFSLELLFRLAGYNFERPQSLLDRTAIFYHKPEVPLPPVFFRRAGPTEWTGQVLHQLAAGHPGYRDEYKNEPAITVQYDSKGLRNRAGLNDWDIVVAGDSFVESGHLPDEDLFTTEIGRLLHARVKNLGLSWSGPFSYSAFLKSFGAAPSAHHALMVFYEGDDFYDMRQERKALDDYNRTGARKLENIEPQPSLTRAGWRLTKRAIARLRGQESVPWADLKLGDRTIPVTLDYAPPASADLSAADKANLSAACQEWAAVARNHHMTPWLVFMPCKRRVFYPGLQTRENDANRSWRTNDLPQYVGKTAAECGLRFIDLSPALTEQTRAGVLTFNPVYDSHLNRDGSRIAAKIIAEAIHR